MMYEKSIGIAINNLKTVKVKKMHDIVEIMSIAYSGQNAFENILKLDKQFYMLKDTGEVKEYNKSENRANNISGLKDSFKKIRDLINNNFTGQANELHLTLTYAENMTDTKRLYNDFMLFFKRYKYNFGVNIDYLSVIEPQGRGAWHCHVLLKHNDKDKIYIKSSDIAKIWGQGFIKVKALKGVDNIGAYLSAYLGDIELTQDTISVFGMNKIMQMDIKQVEVSGKQKTFIKGGRLYLYPPGMNLYRHSKGIRYPDVVEMEYQEAKKIVGSHTPNYSTTIKIYDDTKKLLNAVTYEQYNTRRL